MKDKKNPSDKFPTTHPKVSVEEIATFCKRKGFVYSSSEIYGGLAGFYDYGHVGTLMKKNLEKIWLKYFLGLNDNFYQIETSEIMPEKVFLASGHLKNFTDMAVKCKKGHIERADQLLSKHLKGHFEGLSSEEVLELIKKNKIICSTCKGTLDYIVPVNMMFPISLGVGESTKAFLRPETAQSPYVNFRIQYELTRSKLPLGLALIGRAYRNELSPRNLLIRQRAFNQAELQIFFNPSNINEHSDFENIKNYKLQIILANDKNKEAQEIYCLSLSKQLPKFYVYYMAKVQQFYLDILQIPKNKFRFSELSEKEKAFYNKYHFDMEIDVGELGWTEMGGVHYRTDHDLKGHQEISKQNLSVFDEETKQKFIPHVLELSFGIDRIFQTIIALNYNYNKMRDYVVLSLPGYLAPYQIAIFPLISKGKILKIAREIYTEIKDNFQCLFDDSGSIGRRYARSDESGIPFCVTVDEQSLKNKDVTIRDRNTTKQIRIKF